MCRAFPLTLGIKLKDGSDDYTKGLLEIGPT